MSFQTKATTKKHQKFDNRIVMKENGFIHKITINWEAKDTISDWNETCANIIEVFGLPGDRFMTHPTFQYMEVAFKSARDADLCKILISEKL